MSTINHVYEWQGDDTQPYPQNYKWRTKKFLVPIHTTFGAARVIAEVGDREDYYESLASQAAVIQRNVSRISANQIGGSIAEEEIGVLEVNGDNLETVPTVASYSGDFNLSFKLYVEGVLKFTKEVYSPEPFRLGDGFRGRWFEFEIEGNVTVRRLDVGASMDDIKLLQ